MNSELTLTREQILAFQSSQDDETLDAICAAALRALHDDPKPFVGAPKDERFIYAFHNIWKCWIAIRWDGEFWFEKTKTTRWPCDAFDCYVPFSALPTPKDK